MTETTALPHEANHSSTAVEPRLTWFERFVAWNWSNRRGGEGRRETDPRAEYWRQRFIMATGAAGENGEVLELLKKHARDGHLDEHQLALELGDALVYLTRIAQDHGLTLDFCMRLVVGKLKRRNAMGKDPEGEQDPHELLAWSRALRAAEVAACCGRPECGGECGNEWRGTKIVPIDAEDSQ